MSHDFTRLSFFVRALAAAGCEVVVCDDGLQHYRLRRDVEIEVWQTGISRLEEATLKRVLLSYRDGFTTEEYSYIANAGVIHVPMPAFGAMILYHKCEDTVSEK